MRVKSIILLSIICVFAVILGFIFKEEVLFINIGDTYYVANYFTLSIYLLYFIVVFVILKLLLKLILKTRSSR